MRLLVAMLFSAGLLFCQQIDWVKQVKNRLVVDAREYNVKCDGLTNDSTALSNAIAGAATGAILEIPKGTCVLTTTVTINKSLTLRLNNTVLQTAGNPGISITASAVNLVGASKEVSSITSVTADANVIKVGAALSDISFAGITVSANNNTSDEANRDTGNSIYIQGDSTSPLTTCATRTSRVAITGAKITGGNNGILAQCAEYISVTNTVFVNSHAGLAQVSFHSTNNSQIVGNLFYDSGHTANAIYLVHLTGYASTNNVVTNNVAEGTYDYEVINVFGKNNVISHNALSSTSVAVGGSQAGIRITQPVDTSASTSGNIVVGNRIKMADSATGVGIQANDNGSSGNFGANDTVISDNIIQAPSGIVINNYSKRTTISANKIYQSGYTCVICDGISLQGSSVTNLQVFGNFVSSSSRYGIYINSPVSADISNNYIVSASYGLVCGGAANRVMIKHNIVTASTNDGINTGNCTNVQYFGNLSYSNGGTNVLYSTATFDGTALDRMLIDNNQAFYAKLASGALGDPILYRDPSNNLIVRNTEATGLVTIRTNGDVDRFSVLSDGQIRLHGSSGSHNQRIIAGSGAPVGACSDGSLYLRDDGGAGTSLYVCELGSWVGK